MKIWLTGGSSGLGMYTAWLLAQAGHTVVAGARSFTKEKKLSTMHQVQLDVSDDESVAAFVRRAQEITGTVDAVIHCAAVMCMGPCEETTPEEYMRVMNTNFLGMVRVNQAVLPLMREKRGGRIIMFSSINGLMGIPFQSAYVASKHAVEGYAECLHQEVIKYGIQVCLIEPGDHRGGAAAYRKHAQAMDEQSVYSGAFTRTAGKIRNDEADGADPVKLGQKVVRLLEKKRMPFRKRIAKTLQHGAVLMHKIFPGRTLNNLLHRYYVGGK